MRAQSFPLVHCLAHCKLKALRTRSTSKQPPKYGLTRRFSFQYLLVIVEQLAPELGRHEGIKSFESAGSERVSIVSCMSQLSVPTKRGPLCGLHHKTARNVPVSNRSVRSSVLHSNSMTDHLFRRRIQKRTDQDSSDPASKPKPSGEGLSQGMAPTASATEADAGEK